MKLAARRRTAGGAAAGSSLVAAAIVFGGFVALGAMSSGYGLFGFVVLALAALLASRATEEADRLVRPVAVAERAGEPLEAVIAGVPDPVIALDRNGRVLTLNEGARSLAPALRQGEPVSLALRMPELIEAIGRAYATGDEQRVEYSERVPIDRWFEVIVKPVRRDPKLRMPDLVLMTFHDLTPLRRVEEMRADFVANASHELRTPLAALSGFIETLQGSARDDAKARERFLPIMQEQARRMARLIDDLLSLSRIELNAHRRPDTPVDLVPIVRQVADGLQTLARDRGVTVHIDAANALRVPGDRDELVRVFENLVENALKYGAAGKRVDIAFSRGRIPRRRAGSADQRARLRAGHRAGARSATDRALLSRRCARKPRPGRNRARAGAGQAHPQPAPRPAFDRKHARRGRYIHCLSSPGRCRRNR